MNIRAQGKELAANVTVVVGVVSLGVTGVVSFALWRDTPRAGSTVGTTFTSDDGGVPQSGFSDDGSQQLVGPANPGQGFAPQARSSGS
jgi:hypothetical protein